MRALAYSDSDSEDVSDDDVSDAEDAGLRAAVRDAAARGSERCDEARRRRNEEDAENDARAPPPPPPPPPPSSIAPSPAPSSVVQIDDDERDVLCGDANDADDRIPRLVKGVNHGSIGAFYTLVPIRPRWRGGRRSLRTFPGASLRPHLAFNPRPRRRTDAFQLHPDVRSYGTTRRPRAREAASRAGRAHVVLHA